MKWAAVLVLLLSISSFANENEIDRDPSALVTPPVKRLYPGGTDEEDLKVQPSLPDVTVRTDARGIQKEVYKSLYNQELKDEAHGPPMEE